MRKNNRFDTIWCKDLDVENGVMGGGGDVSVGTIIPYMGTTPPKDFLACDGEIYNIAKYQQLANHINRQFGSYNFFGGDGTTTFAVPDLRGEFLRGTGTNSHTNQGNGANVGVHQDGTEHIAPYYNNNTVGLSLLQDTNTNPTKQDHILGRNYYAQLTGVVVNPQTSTAYGSYTSRPTNTSVLYCIKYKYSNDITNATSLDETLLYSGNDLVVVDNPPTIRVNYTLSDNYNNYDYIILEVVAPSAISSAVNYCTITVKMPLGSTLHHPIFSPSMYNPSVDAHYDYNGFVEFNNDNIIQFAPRFMGSDIRGIILSKVIGIKKNSLSTADIAEMAMPSDVEIVIDNIASTTLYSKTYNAPANGYCTILGVGTSSSGFMRIFSSNRTRGETTFIAGGNTMACTLAVRCGESVELTAECTSGKINNLVLKFIYSIGDAKALGLI